jgi:hypothetical protein
VVLPRRAYATVRQSIPNGRVGMVASMMMGSAATTAANALISQGLGVPGAWSTLITTLPSALGALFADGKVGGFSAGATCANVSQATLLLIKWIRERQATAQAQTSGAQPQLQPKRNAEVFPPELLEAAMQMIQRNAALSEAQQAELLRQWQAEAWRNAQAQAAHAWQQYQGPAPSAQPAYPQQPAQA